LRKILAVPLPLTPFPAEAAALGKLWVADSLLTPVFEVTWTVMVVEVFDRGVWVLFVAGVTPAGGVVAWKDCKAFGAVKSSISTIRKELDRCLPSLFKVMANFTIFEAFPLCFISSAIVMVVARCLNEIVSFYPSL
jgi:hypothetical protein